MQRSYFRTLFGAGLIGVAGVSLTAGIFPWMISMLFGMNSFEGMFSIRGFIMPIALLWAFGGGILGWYGGAYTGLVIIGICGIISGFVLGVWAVDGDFLLVAASTLSGLIYGGVAGLIIGRAFPQTED